MKNKSTHFKNAPMSGLQKLTIVIFILTSSCSPELKVFTDRDPSYDISLFKTFTWSPVANIEQGKNPLYYNELNDKRIKQAVQDQMISRGYELTDDDADFTLHYHIIVQDQSVVTTDPFGHSYSPYWLSLQNNYYQYTEGTLVLDIMRTGSNDLVWRGWAISIINEGYKPQEIDKLIQNGVAKIFKDFPHSRTQLQKTEVIQD
ncbi:MAG TPA: DUF4136 domain-containing protein [Cyclobacteriaceae bacterium]|nr:DUF4136 domain-containing protein [Cyclobacteriaceae bacterium]